MLYYILHKKMTSHSKSTKLSRDNQQTLVGQSAFVTAVETKRVEVKKAMEQKTNGTNHIGSIYTMDAGNPNCATMFTTATSETNARANFVMALTKRNLVDHTFPFAQSSKSLYALDDYIAGGGESEWGSGPHVDAITWATTAPITLLSGPDQVVYVSALEG
jgi:hypothetical protein